MLSTSIGALLLSMFALGQWMGGRKLRAENFPEVKPDQFEAWHKQYLSAAKTLGLGMLAVLALVVVGEVVFESLTHASVPGGSTADLQTILRGRAILNLVDSLAFLGTLLWAVVRRLRANRLARQAGFAGKRNL